LDDPRDGYWTSDAAAVIVPNSNVQYVRLLCSHFPNQQVNLLVVRDILDVPRVALMHENQMKANVARM
jgi:hypothetical protein